MLDAIFIGLGAIVVVLIIVVFVMVATGSAKISVKDIRTGKEKIWGKDDED